jgi:hypothetical protein
MSIDMASFVTETQHDDLKNKVINMKVISKLQPHVRLDTSSKLFKIYVPTAYMPVWVQRWWAVHNRKTDIARVTLLYEDVFKVAEKGVEDDDKVLLMTALKESINGLNNLKTTYEEDITCAASIEYIIERIRPYITEEQ